MLDLQHYSGRILVGGKSSHKGQPAVFIFAGSTDHTEEFVLNLSRDWASRANAYENLVDAADGGHLSSSACEENLVRQVKEFSSNSLLVNGNSEMLADLTDNITRNAGKD